MKILAFSDLHRDRAAARAIVDASGDADVVVGAGDFGTRGEGTTDTLEILRETEVPTVLVSGNHDDLAALQGFCADWETGNLLHGAECVIDAVCFFGLGHEVPRRNGAAWNAFLTEEDAAGMLEPCPPGAVLVTHSPPLGTADTQKDGTSEGSAAVLAAIEAKQPVLHLCGHIHYSWGRTGIIGATPVHNLGPTLNRFEI